MCRNQERSGQPNLLSDRFMKDASGPCRLPLGWHGNRGNHGRADAFWSAASSDSSRSAPFCVIACHLSFPREFVLEGSLVLWCSLCHCFVFLFPLHLFSDAFIVLQTVGRMDDLLQVFPLTHTHRYKLMQEIMECICSLISIDAFHLKVIPVYSSSLD